MQLRKSSIFLGMMFTVNIFLTTPLKAQVNGNQDVSYVSPKQGSYLNHPSTNILIRYSKNVQQNTLGFIVSTAGKTIYITYKLLDDGKTVLIHPLSSLPINVSIQVSSNEGILLEGNKIAKQVHFNFYTTDKISTVFMNNEKQMLPNNAVSTSSDGRAVSSITDTIAKQMPITVTANNHTSTGYYFISTIQYNITRKNRCMILDPNGKIIFDRIAPYFTMDFKKISDSTFSYFNWEDSSYKILDQHFNEIDRIVAGNGYITDNHELQFDKATGHYFLLAQQYVNINMADSVAGGNPNAYVLGLIIQELDQNKNVVFEWKTLDYLPITASVGQNLLADTIDYIHCNAISIDSDTTLLLSSRHLNEIERIDRRTGALIWRLGLHSLHNDFTFINDAIGFTYQHDIRRLPNGNITVFDDGNLRGGAPQYSRAVEYSLDEVNKTATLVWQYRHNPDVNALFMGNVQRLPNKNTVVGWGGASTIFTELDSSNNKVLEITMPQAYSYRSFRFDIQDIINLNQTPLNQFGTLNFCNEDSLSIYNNLNTYLLPQNLAASDSTQIVRNGNTVNVYTKTLNDFYNSSVTNLNFQYSTLEQNDTLVCKGANLMLNIAGNCDNASYHWSTADTTSSINVSPTAPSSYWVDVMNGNFIKRDSINIMISSVPDFTINGNKNFSMPNQIDTFWIPYNTDYRYTWNIEGGNIISVLNSDTILVQMDSINSTKISSIVTNQYNCTNMDSITVTYLQLNAGINEINAAHDYSVYPNPSSQNIFIDGKPGYIYTLYDMNGRTIFQSENTSNQHEQINLEALNSGIYFLYIIRGDRTEKYKIGKL